MQVKIVDFEEQAVAVLEHQGAQETIAHSVGKFIEWRKSSKLSPVESSATYGIPHSDPATCSPEDFRFDICGAVDGEVPKNPQGVILKTIPGGRCAVTRHIGSTNKINETLVPLYAEWLPASGEELRDFPCFFRYIKRVPQVAEHEQVTDIYLPIR